MDPIVLINLAISSIVSNNDDDLNLYLSAIPLETIKSVDNANKLLLLFLSTATTNQNSTSISIILINGKEITQV